MGKKFSSHHSKFSAVDVTSHQPVMLQEVVDNLVTNPNGIYVDATFGRGGHAKKILQQLNVDGKLYAFDRDPTAIEYAQQQAEFADSRFEIWQQAFVNLKLFMEQRNLVGKIQGILLDLGVSSPQLNDAQRGFSFLREGPLDMRMDPEQGMTAAEWISEAKEEEIARVLHEYGEERFAKRIAAAIVQARKLQSITTTTQLAEIITRANPRWEKHKHAATRSFQAIRIFINQELEQLAAVLEQCLEVLAIGGHLCVLSFHSLEDRIVKQFIQFHSRKEPHPQLKKIAKLKPTREETFTNPRARSAILRVAEKIL